MRIILQEFGGEIPRRSAELLPALNAQTAKNCKLYSGEIRPFAGLRRVAGPSKAGTIQTIYRWGATAGGDAEGLITGVSQANPAEITSAGHGLTTGQSVFISGVNGGSHQVNNAEYTVTVTGTDTFTLDGADGTAWDAYSSGGAWVKRNGYWFHWTADVDAVRGPVPGDTTERTYYTGDGVPKMTYSPIAVSGGGTGYPTNSYDLGIPQPTTAPVVSLQDKTGSITNATNADPVVITSADHELETGNLVEITGVNGMTQLNGNTYFVVRIDDDKFALRTEDGQSDIDGTGFGTYTSGGTWDEEYPSISESDRESRAYVYTFVSALGEEGPPSDPSNVLNWEPGQEVSLSSLSTSPPSGNYNISSKRIYRTATGATGTEYLFVTEVSLATPSYTDKIPTDSLAEVLQSTLWDPPPDDLTSLIALPNGVMAGVSKNLLCMSEPKQPHAWPALYQQPANYDFVGCGNFDTTVVAVTTEDVYLANGATPESVTLEALNIGQGGVSKRGIVSVGRFGVIIPTPDGLLQVGRGGAQMATAPYFTPDEWQALKPESIHAYLLDGRYVGFYDNGSEQGGFIFDPSHPEYGLVFIDTYATAGYRDSLADALYLQVGDYIERWDADTLVELTYTWRSKRFDIVEEVSFTCAEVHADAYNDVTLKLYADDTLVHTEVVSSNEPFRISAYDSARIHEIEVTGTDNIKRIAVAESFDELVA